MKYLCAIIVLCYSLNESQSTNSDKTDFLSLPKANSTSEQKVWNINLNIYFTKTLPHVVRKSPGTNVSLKCEAIMNFTKVKTYIKNKEGVETSFKEAPPDYIQQTLMKNVKVNWFKDNKPLSDYPKVRITTKIDKANGTIGSNLRIKSINSDDEGNYTCVIKHLNHEKKQTSRLIVDKSSDGIENYEIPTYTSLFPTAVVDDLEISVKTTPELVSEGRRSQSINKSQVFQNSTFPRKLEPVCQEYSGRVCSSHLKGQFVYIPYDTTQNALEDKLMKAIQVTKFSNDISSHCEGYALPSLCYSTFPICRNPLVTNDIYFQEAKQMFAFDSAVNSQIGSDDTVQIYFENLPEGMHPHLGTNVKLNKNLITEVLNYRSNSTILRRVCKQDCEILETELCQREYAIAKRHPDIGQQLTLEDCQDLPEDDPECLKIGIGAVMVSDDQCYWENGNSYLGRVNVASNGMQCVEWSKQWHVRVFDYPELAGRHSYCRNPGGIKSQPWCIVDKEGKTEKEICDIPKCAHKIWIYIVVIFLLVTLTIVGFVACVCYKNKNKGNATTIRQFNLPNADKNIYGNSRLNSPIEMSDLLTTQSSTNQPHMTRNTRGNGIIRIPQYSLSQIQFLEELGEGAFGKVYKGAIEKNGETQYVAVKALKENASLKTQSDFRREIDLISELTHENIVCIVGVALREEPLCMLFEFMARGDLHEFLMGRAPPSGKGLPHMRLLNIAHNIASGMQYLASHHYVHRDLAARNCLVSDDFVVKISDFGLSRDIYSSDYYRVQSKSLLPVRWMPPESILYGKFTTESDIWSYGVVLWEIYSYGLQPYYGYCNQEVIAMVRGGQLLDPPAKCPPSMYELMQECWTQSPQRRPDFEEIVNRISSWITMGGFPVTQYVDSDSIEDTRKLLTERVPLLVPHYPSSPRGIATSAISVNTNIPSGSSSKYDDNSSICSEAPPLAPKAKKHSSGSLIDTEKIGTKDTVVRIPNAQFAKEI